MPRKPKSKPNNPAEYKRFVETARKLGADESPEVMERAFKKVPMPKPSGRLSRPSEKKGSA
jgi:hypothetical protein